MSCFSLSEAKIFNSNIRWYDTSDEKYIMENVRQVGQTTSRLWRVGQDLITSTPINDTSAQTKLYYFQYFDLHIQINIIYQWNEENISNNKKKTISHRVTARGQGVCPPYWMSCFSFFFVSFIFPSTFTSCHSWRNLSILLVYLLTQQYRMSISWGNIEIFFILVCSSKWWLNELFWKNDKANVIMWSMQAHLDAD